MKYKAGDQKVWVCIREWKMGTKGDKWTLGERNKKAHGYKLNNEISLPIQNRLLKMITGY